jgi:hypothetical protein
MKFRRNLLSRQYRNSDPDADSGGGGFAEPVDTSTPDAGTVDAGTVDTPSEPKAGSMLEAMFGQKPATPEEQAEAAATGQTVAQLRDDRGRFAGKAPADPNAPPVDPLKKPNPADPTQMPEGLTPKAQERFQTLANTNKELTARVTEWEPVVNSALELQKSFHENGVKREQFDQAMQVVGLMNRGDLEGALAALDEQRRMISLHLGRPVPGADALAEHPDLRADVDNLQLTEARALEIARSRMIQNRSREFQQRQQQESQQQEQEQQRLQQDEVARKDSVMSVDKFCKQMQQTDLDYARIEPLLLQQIQGGLLEGVPHAHRAALVQKTYALIKQTAQQTRGMSGATTTVLRPTGGEAPTAKPKSAYEAMWGASKPAGA